MSEIEKDIQGINAALKDVGDQLKAHAEDAQKQIKAHAQMSEETKQSVDKLLVTQGELNARLQAAEQIVAKLESGGGTEADMTVGEEFTGLEGFKAFASTGKGTFTHKVKAAVVSDQGSGGNIVTPDYRPGIVAPGTQRLFLRDLLTWGRTSSDTVNYVRETGFTNSAAPVSENPTSNKPESDLTFELASSTVATIAHWIRASKQVLSDMPMMQSYINGRMSYGLKLKEEAQLLKGSGSGLNINGIYTQATAYSNPGVTVASETAIDRLRLAMLQVQLAEYAADGIVISPIDWAEIELTKDSQYRYVFTNPSNYTMPMLWGLPVVATQSLDATEFLVGSFSQGAMGWDREDASITVSTEDRDNFVKNMVTILCEERIALTVERPEAFVKGELVFSS